MSDEPDIRLTPVVRTDMPEGRVAAIDRDGNRIVDEWVELQCIGCGDKANAPKVFAQGFTPDPETGIYRAMCGKCTYGRNTNYFNPDEDVD